MAQQEFISGLSGITSSHLGCVATIGSFDGVHLGHQALLAKLKSAAKDRGLASLVIIFEPQPFEFFSRDKSAARITRLREKVKLLFGQGVDRVLCLKFDPALRSLTAKSFVEQVLVDRLGVRHLVIGDDFRFGCDRAGDFAFLRQCGQQHNFSVVDTETQLQAEARISSTRIRKLLQWGEFEQAKALLGREFTISGRVIHGNKLGREFGFPTANLALGRIRAPVQGVYAVTVSWPGEPEKKGVANVGVRPTVAGLEKPVLEAHVLDSNQELYGKCLTVKFKRKLRDEMRFSTVELLQKQIKDDIEAANAWFQH